MSQYYDENELPDGWVREYDHTHNHPFWVDTNMKPPRAIWTHPYEDEQFLREHPEIKARLAKAADGVSSTEAPPPYTPRRHSYSGSSRPSTSELRPPASSSQKAQSQRGFFGKLKDKTIGTKEEREEARRQEAILMQRRAEIRRKQMQELRRQQEEYERQQRYSMPVAGSSRMGSSRMGGGYYAQPYGQSMYGPPVGSPYGYGRPVRQGGGYGDLALPLIGGLAGGLLLGDLLGGGF